jgi:molecular chaperone GrpE
MREREEKQIPSASTNGETSALDVAQAEDHTDELSAPSDGVAESTPEEVEQPEAAESAKVDPQAELRAQIESLVQERAALYDQLLRRQAEFENYRKRIDRERAEVYQRARAEVLLELLPVLDNFERALASLEKSEGDAASLRHGVELIHRQFKDALTKLGLQPVEAVGQTFDPHLHEAVTIEPTDEHEENTVIEEFERGYKLGDKLLRPAKVKVAANPESR